MSVLEIDSRSAAHGAVCAEARYSGEGRTEIVGRTIIDRETGEILFEPGEHE